jgi:hypothetical protein
MPEEYGHDPRVVLKRDKYFSLRPQPLEQWLWRQGVPPSAERVFWLHWQEGMRNADWCSEVPLRRVAQQCCLDVSTVTRSYQLLSRLGLIRRQDPGRDPLMPFQQATAITEVLLPRELLLQLDRYPNRAHAAQDPMPQPSDHGQPHAAASAPVTDAPASAPATAPASARTDPFPGLSLRQKLRALAELTALMSPCERRQFDEAQRLHARCMAFDDASRLGPGERATVLQWLEACALRPTARAPESTPLQAQLPASPRQLTVFELARLRRELQAVLDPAHVAERLREVVWSIEEGALRRFQSLHAMRIALKKIRDGLWSRPHRMPPNWARTLTRAQAQNQRRPARTEVCRTA